MAQYTVEDTETGKQVTFEWNDPNPPTDADMEQIFSAARGGTSTPKQNTGVGMIGKVAGRIAGSSIMGPIGGEIGSRIGQSIVEDPRGAALNVAETLPAVGAVALPMAAAAGTGGTSLPASVGLSALGAAGGEGGRQLIRRAIGEEPVGEVAIPFAGNVPKIPGVRKEVSNLVWQGGLAAGLEGVGRGMGFLGKTKIVQQAKEATAKGFRTFTKWLTNLEPKDVERVMQEPSLVLPKFAGGPVTKQEAGKLLGTVEEASGFTFKPDQEVMEKATGPFKSLVGKRAEPSQALEAARDYMKRAMAGEELTDPEILDAYRKTNRALTKMSRKDKLFAQLTEFKNTARTYLYGKSPQFAAADSLYGKISAGEHASNIIPRTDTGKPSIGRSGFGSLVLGGLGGLGGAALGNQTGENILTSALSGIAITSPAAHTGAHLLSGAASRAAGALMANPNVARLMYEIGRRRMESQ